MTDVDARRAFLQRLPETRVHADDIICGRVRLLVSSTSWTPDEDFGLLLGSLKAYSERARTEQLPPLLLVITGKGPQKEHYLARIAALALTQVTIATAWLSLSDYALLLAAADLGISLHTSSSGVDLPMKVVDMFGAGLPVVGYAAYASWSELVREGENGCGFTTTGELTELLVTLLGTPTGRQQLSDMAAGARTEGLARWDDEWDSVAGRLFGFVET